MKHYIKYYGWSLIYLGWQIAKDHLLNIVGTSILAIYIAVWVLNFLQLWES